VDKKTLTDWNEWNERVVIDNGQKDPKCLLNSVSATLGECEVCGQLEKRP